jgi:hypothetical protein
MTHTLRTLFVSGLGALALAALPSAGSPAGVPTTAARAASGEDHGFIGITLREGDEGETFVAGVLPDTAAAGSDLRAGDRLVEVAGKPVDDTRDVFAALEGHPPGATISLVIERDGERRELALVLGGQPGASRITRLAPSGRAADDERLRELLDGRSEASERWSELLERHADELRSELDERADRLRDLLGDEDASQALRDRLEGAAERWRAARAQEIDRFLERMRALAERESRPEGLLRGGGLHGLPFGTTQPLPRGFYAPEIRVPEMNLRVAPIAPRLFPSEDLDEHVGAERSQALDALRDELGALRGEVEALRDELSELRSALHERR